MKLTPLDIKKQEFTRTFRGVDPQEVHSFLQMLSDQWSSLLDENGRLEQKVRDLDGKLEHYRKIEEALQEALETARDNSHKTIENAQREAQIILREARNEAEEIRKKGTQDLKRLKHDISKISGRRDEVVARLRAFLMSEMELLARFEGQDHVGSGYVRLSNEGRQLESRSYYEDSDGVDDEDTVISTHKNRGQIDVNAFPVDLPLNEEEVSFEEYTREREKPEPRAAPAEPQQNKGSRSSYTLDDFASAEREQGETDFVDNEVDFVKSTVNTSSVNTTGASNKGREFLKSIPNKKNGFSREKDKESSESFSLNDRFAQKKVTPEGKDKSKDQEPKKEKRSGDTFKTTNSGEGWIVKPVINQGSSSGFKSAPSSRASNRSFTSQIFDTDNDDELSATPEEIEKIRRILNDLD